jgi:hypothetical protein
MARGFSVVLLLACACGRTNVRPNFDAASEATLVVQPERLLFPPTLIGTTSTKTVGITNAGSAEFVELVAPPPFGVTTNTAVPEEGLAVVPVDFAPTTAGPATGTLRISAGPDIELAVALEGEGLHYCGVGCNDGDACTIDECDEQRGCFHEPVICPAPFDHCLVSECQAAFGCQTVAAPDGTPCGASVCGGTRVCRAGECAEAGGAVRLVGNWTFDEMDGTTVVDASGLGHHGSLVAGTRVPARRNRGITHAAGSLLVDVTDHPDFAFAGSFTVQVWIQTPDALPDGQQVMVFRGDAREGLDPLVFSMQPYGAKFLVESPFDGTVVDPRAPLLASMPVQLTGVFDAEALEARSYVDCALVEAKCSAFSSPIRELDARFDPGVGLGGHARRGGNLYAFRGVLDEVRIYEGAMTPADIASSCTP